MAMDKNIVIRWLVPLASAAVVGGVFLFWQRPAPRDTPNVQAARDTPVSAKSDSNEDIVDLYSQSEALSGQAGSDDSALAGQMSSADHVELGAFREGDNVRIELEIEEHWHINANPASFDFLIPTEFDISADDDPLPAILDYPAGEEIDVGLDDPIRVYSRRLKLTANLAEPGNKGPLKVQARVQACNDSGLCLPPSTLSASTVGSAQSSSP